MTSVINEYQWETLKHSPYSPDLSPCDFDLIPELRKAVKRNKIWRLRWAQSCRGQGGSTYLLWLPSNRNWRLTEPMERSHRKRGKLFWRILATLYGRSLQFIVFMYSDHSRNILTDPRTFKGPNVAYAFMNFYIFVSCNSLFTLDITKTNLFKYTEKFTTKTWKFSDKNSDIFHISAQNIDCGDSLEPPRRGGSNEYPQSMFSSKKRKNNVYPCKPHLLYKSGV